MAVGGGAGRVEPTRYRLRENFPEPFVPSAVPMFISDFPTAIIRLAVRSTKSKREKISIRFKATTQLHKSLAICTLKRVFG